MTVIFCFEKKLKDRQSKNHFNVVENHCEMDYFISKEKIGKVFCLRASLGNRDRGTFPEQAQEMHEFIRQTVRTAFGVAIAENVSILWRKRKTENAKRNFQNQMLTVVLLELF
jgi:triosephosphate isomerase